MTSREILIKRMRENIPDYFLYNSLALDSMLSRLQGMLSGKGPDFKDDLELEDDDSNGFMQLETI